MKSLPKNFSEIISKNFYDKEITIYNKINTIDEEGNEIIGSKELKSTIICNITPTSNTLIKEKYGLDIEANYLITCNVKENINLNDICEYLNVEYVVTGIFNFDTHKKIIIGVQK